MIHHVSISARDPKHVADVLAELMKGRAYPFPGGVADSFMAVSGDEHGSMIEVYPENVTLVPGRDDKQVRAAHDATPGYVPFHLLLSVPVDRATVERIGEREGWRTQLFRPRRARPAAGVPCHRVLAGEPDHGRGRHAGHAGGVYAADPLRHAGRAFRRPRGGVNTIVIASAAKQSPSRCAPSMEIAASLRSSQ